MDPRLLNRGVVYLKRSKKRMQRETQAEAGLMRVEKDIALALTAATPGTIRGSFPSPHACLFGKQNATLPICG